jgi:hypothetical protein
MGHTARRHNHTRPDRLEARQDEAIERQAAYDALTLAQKLIRAGQRGHSRTNEFKRLTAAKAAA